MNVIPELPHADPRLARRYQALVLSHLSPAQRVAAGLRMPPTATQAFAATQAAWRFYANPRLSLPQLATPLRACAQTAIRERCADWALIVLDWSLIHYPHHAGKADRIPLANARDWGYELLTALALSDQDGAPLAPLCLEWRAQPGVYSTRTATVQPASSPLDALTPVLASVTTDLAPLPPRPVFILDRGADSVGHYRRWHQAGYTFLVRAEGTRCVRHAGQEQRLAAVATALQARPGLTAAGDVWFHARRATLWLAETEVVLHRPARQHRVDPTTGRARHHEQAGPPLPLRLIVSEVRERESGAVLAQWLLLTNLPTTVPPATVARWYYWRWRIETYHKLLKSAGQHVEQWQQERGAALVRRLLIAALAVVVVWHLARATGPEAAAFRALLVRLSGRQMRRGARGRPCTAPALLAGLGILLPMLALLQRYELAAVRRLATAVLPGLVPLGGG